MNKFLVYTIPIIGMFILAQIGFAALTVGGSGAGPIISVEPSCLKVSPGENFTVNININPEGNEIGGADYILRFDNALLNATSLTPGTFFNGCNTMTMGEGINNTAGKIDYGEYIIGGGSVTEPGTLTTITFQVVGEYGVSKLDFETVTLSNSSGYGFSNVSINNGTVEIVAPPGGIFDTKAPDRPYPSIFGVHNGTITPNRRIEANRIYTYACPGTGGHTESVRIWGNGVNAHANWSGYSDDWHNLTFNTSFTLEPGKEYNYTIHTGSYPQIIHHPGEYNATGGKIICDEFIDANGKKYEGWIPAFRLWKKEG